MTESTQDPGGERDAAGVLTPPDEFPSTPAGAQPRAAPGAASAGASRRVGKYQIVRQIGRGGMATVYLARQQPLDRGVALKELSLARQGMAQRFLREARLASLLNHPNIVTVHEYFEEGGVPYIAMEYAPRGSLRQYVHRISLAQFAGVMEGVLAGLAHAKEFGIVHRDLKPENIMVSSDGRVKIADFGIAKATASAGTALLTGTGMTVGTPSYMAPEQAMGDKVGVWTDLYSVGVMAWEHLVGRLPFTGLAPMAVLMKQVNEAIPPACEANPEVDPAISAWIDRLLAKAAEQRTRNPSTAWEELEEIVISKLGPRWRREARLPSPSQVIDTPRPLTPAPFESEKPAGVEPTIAEPEAESGYVTFGRPAREPAPAEVSQPAPTPEVLEVLSQTPTPEALEVAEPPVPPPPDRPAAAEPPQPPPGRRVPLKLALSSIGALAAAAIAVVLLAGGSGPGRSSSTQSSSSQSASTSSSTTTPTSSSSSTRTQPPPVVTPADPAPQGALAAVTAYWNDIGAAPSGRPTT